MVISVYKKCKRIAQHYELVGVVLQEEGQISTLDCSASLFIVAWPEEFAITLSLRPPVDHAWENGATIRLELGKDWSIQHYFSGPWTSENTEEITLGCAVNKSSNSNMMQDMIKIVVKNETIKPSQDFAVTYDAHYSCFVADINKPKRKFQVGYCDIRDCDDFTLNIENSSIDSLYIPVLFYVRPAANITGLVPMIYVANNKEIDAKFVQSAIPIQTSKNWHYQVLGDYIRAYTLIPTEPGCQTLHFRIWYGFYGNLCSASHANLSLVGWPKDSKFSSAGRWEQLAIGCFGETFCIDIEMSATTRTITDVRSLMVRKGLDGKKWSWTNAGWGGDWLGIYDDQRRKLFLGGVKTAYLSQGPCLTDVRYSAYYASGSRKVVDLSARVQTMRVDDYARTLHKLRYDFNEKVGFQNYPKTDGSCLFRVGGGVGWEGWSCSKVAIGNGNGLLEELQLSPTLAVKEFAIDRQVITGPSPWWIGFPDSKFRKDDDKGLAWKALIIRSFECKVGGRVVAETPSFSLLVQVKYEDNDGYYVDALITPPTGVDEFNNGDSVEFDCEWITIPFKVSDYYGTNQFFAQHLRENPASWKTIHREASGNNLVVTVLGGAVKTKYPLIIQRKESEVTLTISGGTGAVPVRYEGLDSPNYHLHDENSEIGEKIIDFELGYDACDGTYSLTFNLPLDNRPSSSWTLSQ